MAVNFIIKDCILVVKTQNNNVGSLQGLKSSVTLSFNSVARAPKGNQKTINDNSVLASLISSIAFTPAPKDGSTLRYVSTPQC